MSSLTDALDSFRCCKDIDIETFLREKALTFLSRKLCAIYLLVDEEKFDQGVVEIDAYFTLSHKVLSAADLSGSKIKDTSGFKDSQFIHFVLIGQLGKYDDNTPQADDSHHSISGREILEKAMEVIKEADGLIPCRCVLIECSDHPKVRQFYEENQFSFLQKDGIHNQYYKKIE